MTSAIEILQLSKTYSSGLKALSDINLEVEQGEIFALLGSNGAGKTTLIKILTTLLVPTTGTAKILGKDVIRDRMNVRRHIACIAQKPSLDSFLSLKENMEFQGKLYGLSSGDMRVRMEKLIYIFHLDTYLNYPMNHFSGGMLRRADIAVNMMSNPKILFLDEPTTGMDIASRMSLWSTIEEIRDEFNTTIVLTTHYLEEAEQLSDQIAILQKGRLLIQDSMENLKKHFGQKICEVTWSDVKIAKSMTEKIKKNFPFYSIVRNKETTLIKIKINLFS
ncbi:MAG: ABC transporter ATP-binding protein [Tissierellia bacterium]|nr:ABC transporter ATP-binding protein [Tissierellia bacterium]